MLPNSTGYGVVPAEDLLATEISELAHVKADYDTVLIHTVPEYYPEWIERERALGRRVLGYTVWELERLPNHWPAILNLLDGVLVPCRWNRRVFEDSGVTVPIHVVPHISQFEDRTEPDAAGLSRRLGAAGSPERFVFYTIGHWSNRKAPYLVAEAFLRAFDESDEVSLVIKTSRNDITRRHRHWRNGFRMRHPSPRDAFRRLEAQFKNPPPIVLITEETLSPGEMLALHGRGDCFVSLTRTEGWGLGAFEAARLGKPVIMTGYGGQRDFLDPALSHLIDYDMVAVDEPIWSANYRETDRWAEPSLPEAVAAMKEVRANPTAANARARILADRIRERFSQEAVTRALLGALGA
jgi:glycosyltransferase involved in cell wall biosynthesis